MYRQNFMKEARIASLVSLFPLPQYVVVLEDKDKTRLVPIWIGVNEGNAIALEMNGEKFPRPLTHDLIVNILVTMGSKISKIVITDIRENSYFAEITIQLDHKNYVIDARPSDALAIAVRTKTPIFIDDKVLAKCPAVDKPISQEEVERFKDELKKMTPDEFFKKLESTPGKKKDIQSLLGPTGTETGEEDDDEDSDEEFDEDDPETEKPTGT